MEDISKVAGKAGNSMFCEMDRVTNGIFHSIFSAAPMTYFWICILLSLIGKSTGFCAACG